MGSEAARSVTLRVKKKRFFFCAGGGLEGALTLELIPIDAPGDASVLRCGNSSVATEHNVTKTNSSVVFLLSPILNYP